MSCGTYVLLGRKVNHRSDIIKLEIALTRRLPAENVSHVFLLSTYMTYFLSLIMPRYCRAQEHIPESNSVYVKVFGMDVELNIFLH